MGLVPALHDTKTILSYKNLHRFLAELTLGFFDLVPGLYTRVLLVGRDHTKLSGTRPKEMLVHNNFTHLVTTERAVYWPSGDPDYSHNSFLLMSKRWLQFLQPIL